MYIQNIWYEVELCQVIGRKDKSTTIAEKFLALLSQWLVNQADRNLSKDIEDLETQITSLVWLIHIKHWP